METGEGGERVRSEKAERKRRKSAGGRRKTRRSWWAVPPLLVTGEAVAATDASMPSCVTDRGRGARTRAMQGRSKARAGEESPLPWLRSPTSSSPQARVTVIHGGAKEREGPRGKEGCSRSAAAVGRMAALADLLAAIYACRYIAGAPRRRRNPSSWFEFRYLRVEIKVVVEPPELLVAAFTRD
ncbi:uncharacterized protein LOC130973746 isoform X2 [Arachis stenosperma]|uniref:uncharacterized protein LOC130973746 isoform X2 n=1 Tax=Arachis stenosperma TaxID=217475 RepID=UPI0025ACAB17|nr:uncharacterized protein LOC130973746 isoform X2 [Arachis stenosperma]XP_057754382.1 uncharacterized protein LOC130973746 isoform X2 [Arachis stenosperma]XP_057754383.1 uncharacterized protein LOC130973746 isoform X2 [Arachis stenosperma]